MDTTPYPHQCHQTYLTPLVGVFSRRSHPTVSDSSSSFHRCILPSVCTLQPRTPPLLPLVRTAPRRVVVGNLGFILLRRGLPPDCPSQPRTHPNSPTGVTPLLPPDDTSQSRISFVPPTGTSYWTVCHSLGLTLLLLYVPSPVTVLPFKQCSRD